MRRSYFSCCFFLYSLYLVSFLSCAVRTLASFIALLALSSFLLFVAVLRRDSQVNRLHVCCFFSWWLGCSSDFFHSSLYFLRVPRIELRASCELSTLSTTELYPSALLSYYPFQLHNFCIIPQKMISGCFQDFFCL